MTNEHEMKIETHAFPEISKTGNKDMIETIIHVYLRLTVYSSPELLSFKLSNNLSKSSLNSKKNKSNMKRNNNLKDDIKNRNLKMNARTRTRGIHDKLVVTMQHRGLEYFINSKIDAIFANVKIAYNNTICKSLSFNSICYSSQNAMQRRTNTA